MVDVAEIKALTPCSPAYTNGKMDKDRPKAMIPDLFISFMSRLPPINPHYVKVKLESDDWVSRICNDDEKARNKRILVDTSYFMALFSSEAGEAELRTLCDWCNWVFDFDDMFDDGHLKESPERAVKEIEIVSQILRGEEQWQHEEGTTQLRGLRYVFSTVWERVSQRCSPRARKRFGSAIEDYCSGLIREYLISTRAATHVFDEYMAIRRKTIALRPCLALIEYYHNLDICDEFFESHAVKEMQRCAAEIIFLQNDVLSYHKEHAMGVQHNVMNLFKEQGMSQQAGYDKIDALLRERVRDWYIALSQIPAINEQTDIETQKYIRGCEEVIVAALNWSFKANRYFGVHAAKVRETREVDII